MPGPTPLTFFTYRWRAWQRQFCINSEYYDEKKLAARLRRDAGAKPVEEKMTFSEVKQYLHTREDPRGLGDMTLADIKAKFESNDVALEGMKRDMLAKRERELVREHAPCPRCVCVSAPDSAAR